VPLYCCPTVFEAISLAGHRPAFIDIELSTYGASPRTMEARAGELAAAIVVHMFGFPVDVTAIRETLGSIPVIEDCAHAFGSRYRGEAVGGQGVASIFSFGPAKWPSCTGGGALCWGEQLASAMESTGALPPPARTCTDSLVMPLRHRLRSVRNWAPRYVRARLAARVAADTELATWHTPGENPAKSLPRPIDPWDRVLLERKVRAFAGQLARQTRNARLAMEILQDAPVLLPELPDDAEPNFYVLPLRFDSEAQLLAVAEALAERCVETHRYQRGISQIAARYYGYTGGCPNTELAENTVLWVPFHHGVREDVVRTIAGTIHQALEQADARQATSPTRHANAV
jgi:dTDP-4-amino-4,6-dideoxygalactose transaminase